MAVLEARPKELGAAIVLLSMVIIFLVKQCRSKFLRFGSS